MIGDIISLCSRKKKKRTYLGPVNFSIVKQWEKDPSVAGMYTHVLDPEWNLCGPMAGIEAGDSQAISMGTKEGSVHPGGVLMVQCPSGTDHVVPSQTPQLSGSSCYWRGFVAISGPQAQHPYC